MKKGTYRMPLCYCTVCGHKLDAATLPVGIGRPRPGDFTCCIECAELYVFNPDMTIHAATVMELMEAGASGREELERVQSTIRKARVCAGKKP